MLGKAVRLRYCPATVSDVLSPAQPLPQRREGAGLQSQVRRPVLAPIRYLSFEEKETYANPEFTPHNFIFGHCYFVLCCQAIDRGGIGRYSRHDYRPFGRCYPQRPGRAVSGWRSSSYNLNRPGRGLRVYIFSRWPLPHPRRSSAIYLRAQPGRLS